MALRLKNFVSFKANWEPKSENLRQIARELNPGLDSFVFVDDNPAEIEIVRQFVPEVATVLLGTDPSEYVRGLQDGRYFEALNLTREDGERVSQYRVGATKYLFIANVVNQLSYRGLLLDGHPHRPRDLVISVFAYCVFLRDLMFTPLLKTLVRKFGPDAASHAVAVSIFAVFVVAGIWHGAGWNLLLFGVWNGLGLVVCHYHTVFLRKRLGKQGYAKYHKSRWIEGAGIAVTFVFFSCGLFLLANTLPQMRQIFQIIGWMHG